MMQRSIKLLVFITKALMKNQLIKLKIILNEESEVQHPIYICRFSASLSYQVTKMSHYQCL